MIVAEILALLATVGGIGVGIMSFTAWMTNSRQREAIDRKQNDQMHADLKDALRSGDYHRLDDWMVLYTDRATPEMKKMVTARRDELFIERDA